MRRTTEQVIAATINEGYVLLTRGVGYYNSAVSKYRSEGYDVRYWYTKVTKDSREYVIYGLKKEGLRKRRTTEQVIQDTINEGYVLLTQGVGDYRADVSMYRSEGYDVRYWYTKVTKDSREYIIYGLKKENRRKRRATAQIISTSEVTPVVETTVDIPVSVSVADEYSINFDAMTVKELKSYCKLTGIKGYNKMNKEAMIENLKKATGKEIR